MPFQGSPGETGPVKLKGNFKGGKGRTGYVLAAAQRRRAKENAARYNAQQIKKKLNSF